MSAVESPTSRPAVAPAFDFNAMAGEQLFIGISGLIGAGKTTLATALGKELGLPVHYEPVIDNVYLEDFYKDMGKYSFQLQVYLLNKRFKQQQQIIWQDKGGVQDRTIYEDSVFARMLFESGHLDDRDYQTYLELFKNMSNFMRRPNLIVHLDLTPEESYRRIAMRSRECESGVPLEYLVALHAAYEKFITEIARVIPVIKVDYNEFRTVEEMAAAIKLEYSRISNIREVTFGGPPLGVGINSPKAKKEETAANGANPQAQSPMTEKPESAEKQQEGANEPQKKSFAKTLEEAVQELGVQ
jgi:deoxyadenosine kinase